MNNLRTHTAILFFSRDAFAESIHKPFLGNDERKRNIEFAQLLINQTKQTLAKSGLDVIQFTQHQQCGSNFGEKLTNAFDTVFNLGYEHVIAVGNDTPELAHIDWEEVTDLLTANKAVVGPTQRGGTYLIGLTKHQFKKQAFCELAWQDKSLYTQLVAYFENQAALYSELSPYQEVNKKNDIDWFLNKSDVKWQFFKLLLRLLKSRKAVAFSFLFIVLKQLHWKANSDRGPPYGQRIAYFRRLLIDFFQSVRVLFKEQLHFIVALVSSDGDLRGPPILL